MTGVRGNFRREAGIRLESRRPRPDAHTYAKATEAQRLHELARMDPAERAARVRLPFVTMHQRELEERGNAR